MYNYSNVNCYPTKISKKIFQLNFFVIISVKLVYWVFLVGRIKALEWMLKVGNGKSLIWCTKEKTHFWSHIENLFCNFAHLPAIPTIDHNGALSAGIGIICHFR